MNILAIGSHPDDIEFGCGGALYKFARNGHRVFMYVVTNGSAGGNAVKRIAEQKKSCKLLGAQEVTWGKFKDTALPSFKTVVDAIEHTVKKVEPTFVFVHHGKDTHQDHRHVHAAAVSATRNIANILFYEGPTSYDFDPNVFVTINSQLEPKVASLRCHHSQVMKTNIRMHSILDIARATATFRGTQCRAPFAEAFTSLRLLINM